MRSTSVPNSRAVRAHWLSPTRRRIGQHVPRAPQRLQQQLEEAIALVQRIHSRIGNARPDYLHKTPATISQNHAMVCIEDLQVRNMSKSAAGSSRSQGEMFGLNPARTNPSSIRAGSSSAANWTTSWHRTEAGSSRCRRAIRAGHVPAAAVCRRTTGRRRRNSSASNAASSQTPMWSARSMF